MRSPVRASAVAVLCTLLSVPAARGQIKLGITAADHTPDGVKVTELTTGGAADRMGIAVGDVIVRLNGTKYVQSRAFAAALTRTDSADVVYKRGEKFYRSRAYYIEAAKTDLPGGAMPREFCQDRLGELSVAAVDGLRLGITVQDGQLGAVLGAVEPNGLGRRIGLAPGDRIESVNDQPVLTGTAVADLLRHADSVSVVWQRGMKRFTATVRYKDKTDPTAGHEVGPTREVPADR